MAIAEGSSTLPNDAAATASFVFAPLDNATLASGAFWLQRSPAAGDGLAAKYLAGVGPYTFNETTGDRLRGNTSATLFASAARTGTISVGPLTNYNGRGLSVTLIVTAKAAATTLQIRIFEGTGNRPVAAGTAWAAAVGVTYVTQFYPGVTAASYLANAEGFGVVLPRSYYVQIVHSDASSVTYSVLGDVIL